MYTEEKPKIDELAHYGVKGMKWGKRKSAERDTTLKPVAATPGFNKSDKAVVKTKGGNFTPAHKDAISAATAQQKLKASGPKALSNKEMQDLAKRIQLERQIAELTKPPKSPSRKFITKLLGDTGKQQSQRVANLEAQRAIDRMMAAKRG